MKLTVKILSLALVIFMMCVCPVSVFAAFNDTANSPYEDAINELADIGLVKGISEIEFDTHRTVSRQEMALFIARLKSGLEIDDSPEMENDTIFTDLVNPTFNAAISYCYKNKIIEGRGDNIFDPLGTVAVQEALAMAIRAMGYADLSFPDGYIAFAESNGLLNNLEGINYTAGMARGQVAQLMYNTLHNENTTPGKSFYATFFAPAQKLGYFEISTLEELKQNYEYKEITTSAGTTYRINNVTLLGYDGYILYSFNNDKGCNVSFQFSIQGHFENDPNRPSIMKVVNSTAELSAAEAKALIESVNQKAAAYLNVAPSEATANSIKDNAPSDIYEATAKNYANITYKYRIGFEPEWFLSIHTGGRTGILKGSLTHWVPAK